MVWTLENKIYKAIFCVVTGSFVAPKGLIEIFTDINKLI